MVESLPVTICVVLPAASASSAENGAGEKAGDGPGNRRRQGWWCGVIGGGSGGLFLFS